MKNLQDIVRSPGPATATATDRLKPCRSTPFDDIDVYLLDFGCKRLDLVAALGHQGKEVLVPHEASHAAASGKTHFVLSGLELVVC